MITVKNYPAHSHIVIRDNHPMRAVGDIEVCLDYGTMRIEIWEVIPKDGWGKTSVFITRKAFDFVRGFYKMVGSLTKKA